MAIQLLLKGIGTRGLRAAGHGATPCWRVPDTESTRSWSRVGVIQIQLMLQATGVWLHLQTAAYSAGVR